jgi:hypothetical protein
MYKVYLYNQTLENEFVGHLIPTIHGCQATTMAAEGVVDVLTDPVALVPVASVAPASQHLLHRPQCKRLSRQPLFRRLQPQRPGQRMNCGSYGLKDAGK